MTPTYARDAGTWRRYQPHLPAEVRVEGDAVPREERWAWDGLDVHVDRLVPPGEPRLTVLVLHGGGGYGRLLAPIGRVLAELGCEAVLPDLPGYGLTSCPPAGMTYDRWVRCAVALAEREARRTGRPVGLFGMSMGGMLALHAAGAAAPGVVAAVGATTLMDPRDPQVRRGAGRVPTPAALLRTGALDRVRVPMPLLAPVERMSSSPAINRLCLRDPQGGGIRVPVGFLRSWMTYAPAVEPEAFDRCPVLLVHPLADRWTPPRWSRAVLDRIPAPTRWVGLEGCEHLPMEQPGLTTLRSELAAWCHDAGRCPAPA